MGEEYDFEIIHLLEEYIFFIFLRKKQKQKMNIKQSKAKQNI